MTRSDGLIEITIEKLIEGGKGLGRYHGLPVFVPGVLPGEKVTVRIVERRRSFLEGELKEIVQASPDRIEPPCPYFQACGGCQWQHIPYAKQLEYKREIVRETLRRLGKIENPTVEETLPSPQEFGWRSRVTFHGNEKGEIGFFRPKSYSVVDIEKCLIVEDSIHLQLEEIRAMQPRKKRDYELRGGRGRGFTQVNPGQNEQLKALLREWVDPLPHKTVTELFCGGGNFTEVLLPLAEKITAVDSDHDCIEQAKEKLLQHPETSTHLELLCTDAVRYYARQTVPIDLLVLDPPRDGAGGVVEGVLKTRPKNILYISCNPSTLARDIRFLSDFAGYRLVKNRPIDMFPQSFHIESISLLTYGSPPSN